MLLRIHHINGEIFQSDNRLDVDEVSHILGAQLVVVSCDDFPKRTQKFDEATHSLRFRTSDEGRAFEEPFLQLDIRAARDHELFATDWRTGHPGWDDYRQTLRDLPTAGDGFEMLLAWPLRPDGIDALSAIKSGLN